MELFKLLFNVMLIMVSKKMLITEVCAEINYRLPNNTIPKHYAIWLDVDVEKNIFHGKSNVSITIYEPTYTISLHSRKLDIITNKTSIINIPPKNKRTSICICQHFAYLVSYNDTADMIIIYFENILLPDNYSLHMEYKGEISNMSGSDVGGFFKISFINEKEDREFVSTHNWATGIRQTFPCWDEPGIKAKFHIIVRHHRNYTVLSNMIYTNIKLIRRDTIETDFEETPAMPAYLVAIVLCNLPSVNISANLRGRQQFQHDLMFTSHVIINIRKHLYISPRQQHLAVPGLIDDGMAKWRLILYRDEDIIYDEKRDNIVRKMEITCLIGRKMTREWLSSKTSPSWWSHFWLNEGIATVLFTSKIIDKIIPNSRMSDLFAVQILQESLYLDSQGIMKPFTMWEQKGNMISDINSIFSFSYYIKAPALLRMLQHMVTDQVFQSGINIYLKKQSATPNDFWAAMESAHNKASILPKINISEIMYSWINQSYYPVLNVTSNYNNESHFIIKVKNASEIWWIPLTYTKQSDTVFNYTKPVIKALKDELKIHISAYSKDHIKYYYWIILNLQQIGYYRVNYDAENWLRIAYYLNSKNYTNIHVLNRAQIIDDAFYFTTTSQLNASIFWELTRYLRQETEYTVWYPMIKVLERISYIFNFPSESKYVKTIILRQLKPLLRIIKYNKNRNDSYLMEYLRQEAVKWACVLNDSSCKTMALNKLRRHLTNELQISPGWKEWTYCNGLSIANKTDDLKSVYRIYETVFRKERRSLEFLACSKRFYINSIIIKSEDYNEAIFRIIRENSIDNVNFFHYNVAKHARDNSVLDHILKNWEKAKPEEISGTTALIDIINHVYSEEQLHKIKKFLRNIKEKWLKFSDHYSNLKSLNSKLFQDHEFKKNRDIELISIIHNKIHVRLFQIKNQTNTFVSMFGINPADQKMEDCNV